eukprot:9317698-Alexandrium_andersonii.AAC.1
MVHRLKGLLSQFDGASGRPRSEPVHEALISSAEEWHMRTDDVKKQTLTDLKRRVGSLLALHGGDRGKA